MTQPTMKVIAEFISEPSAKEYNDLGPSSAMSFLTWAVEDQMTKEVWVYWASPEADDMIYGPNDEEVDVIAELNSRGVLPGRFEEVRQTLDRHYGNV